MARKAPLSRLFPKAFRQRFRVGFLKDRAPKRSKEARTCFPGSAVGITMPIMPLNDSDACKLAKKLLAQALDDGTTLEERRTFALKAAKIIGRHKLDVIVGSEVEGDGSVADDLGDAANAVVDLFDRFKRSGLSDALKRVAGAGRRVARDRGSRRHRER